MGARRSSLSRSRALVYSFSWARPNQSQAARRRASVIIIIRIRPAGPRSPKRDAGIDVTIDVAPGRGRHAFGIGPVRAVARNANTPALNAIRIINRGGRTGAGHRGSPGRQQ